MTSEALLPHDLRAEEALLGAMLLSKDAIATAMETLTPGDFYNPAHGHIYAAITALTEAGGSADPVTVTHELRHQGLLEAVGGSAMLVGLEVGTPATTNAGHYAKIIEDHSTLRKMIGAAGEIVELAQRSVGEAPKAVTQALELLAPIVASTNRGEQLATVEELVDDHLDVLERRAAGEGLGLTTGFYDLDEALGGMRGGELCTIGARSSIGKTILGANLALAAAGQGAAVLYATFEMDEPALMDRFVAAEARVSLKRLRRGNLEKAHWQKIADAHTRLIGSQRISVMHKPSATVADIAARARRIRQPGQPLVIVVDYLQLVNPGPSGRHQNRELDVSGIVRDLARLALEQDAHVIALSQLNRNVESRMDKRPTLADLRESGEIENASDIVIGLYRDDYYDTNSPDRGTIELIVLKARNEALTTVRLAFVGEWARLANMARANRGS